MQQPRFRVRTLMLVVAVVAVTLSHRFVWASLLVVAITLALVAAFTSPVLIACFLMAAGGWRRMPRSSWRRKTRGVEDSGEWPGLGATRFGTPKPCRLAPEHRLKTTRGTLSPNAFHSEA